MNQLQKIEFNSDQIALIKKQIAPNANDTELKLFLYQCQRTGLDPLTRQIYCIHRGGRMTIQTSIDGFRVIAERSGDYAGQDEPVYAYNPDGSILSCKVTVYKFRGDVRYPAATATAFFKEYYPNPMNLQKSMPHVMIAKIAEALALRKAFPQDLSGLYTNDEMQQADKGEVTFENEVDESMRKALRDKVYSSTLDEGDRMLALESIETCVSNQMYFKIDARLDAVQATYNDVANPNATDAKKIVKAIVGPKP
jgi:phage recombination protein Bet